MMLEAEDEDDCKKKPWDPHFLVLPLRVQPESPISGELLNFGFFKSRILSSIYSNALGKLTSSTINQNGIRKFLWYNMKRYQSGLLFAFCLIILVFRVFGL